MPASSWPSCSIPWPTDSGSAAIPRSYRALFADPIYAETVVNTLIFLAIGVNLQLFLALLLSGFFMRPQLVGQGAAAGLHAALGGAGDSHLHLHPLDAERPMGLAQQRCSGTSSRWMGRLARYAARLAMGSVIVAYIWKWMPFWTVIFLAGRMAIPQGAL